MSDDAPAPAPAPADRTIPYARFERVVAERNSLKGQLDELTEQVQALSERSATADTLAAQLRDAQAEAASSRARFDTYRTIAGAGITDPELVEAVEWQYGRLPADDRPDLAEVLSSWSATPDEAPAILRPVFRGLGEAPVAPATPRAPRPPTPPTGGAAESGAGDVSAEALAAARQSGDLARLGELLRRGGYARLFSTTK